MSYNRNENAMYVKRKDRTKRTKYLIGKICRFDTPKGDVVGKLVGYYIFDDVDVVAIVQVQDCRVLLAYNKDEDVWKVK